jgi:hypothetical protein
MIFFRIYLLEKIIFDESTQGRETGYKSMVLARKKNENGNKTRKWDQDEDSESLKSNPRQLAKT